MTRDRMTSTLEPPLNNEQDEYLVSSFNSGLGLSDSSRHRNFFIRSLILRC